MRRIGMVIGTVAVVAAMASTAFAGDFRLKISINLGRPTVYRPPVVVYQPARVVYQPAPVVYQPVVLTPPTVIMYPPNPNRVAYVQAPLVVSPPVRRLPTCVTQPVFQPMGRPALNGSRFTAQRDRDDGSFSHGRTTYQPVTRAGGSVYYRQIRNNH